MGLFDSGCDWYCDSCHAYMNNQPGFTTSLGTWICTECGTMNDVSEENIIPENGSDGYVFETEYEDGTTEKIRYTKTREVHDFDGSNGKMSIWRKR
ncbi:Sec23/Sec24 zinc finger-containing protein [uncultured Oscillibacter sp.]|uniref:Sec23/Sec24 zinc finger-containing protein n=1 Tax=uncultured Oscillibacter sp. TaxID=876091 RepID=UPI0025F1E011|nr:Sec23/Sec24 zinc finger-containing protein [uncultured Oscillibacter sp.]